MKLPWTFKQEVEYRLRNKPYLTPVFTSVCEIPERIYRYDDTFFVVRNHLKERFEVHCLENIGDTYSMLVPFKELDARMVRRIYQNDLRVHGKEIFHQIEREEAKKEKQEEREWKNWVEAVGKETRTLFAQDAWTM